MNIIEALLLGIIQGITEWLPISSSGQSVLVLFNIFGISPARALEFSFFLHIGSLIAILIYFGRELKAMLVRDSAYLRFIFYSSAATAIVGLPIYFTLRTLLESIGAMVNMLIGASLVITGIILRLHKNDGKRRVSESKIKDMLVVGAVQGVAVVPGISRSGAIITALLLSRFAQDEALRISFLMAIPAIIGANILVALGGLPVFQAKILTAGIIASAVSSFIMLKFFIALAEKLRFDTFCIFFGSIAVIAELL